jgi:glutaredoxin
MPGMLEIEEQEEESTDDEKEYDMMNSIVQNTVPTISVGEHEEGGATDLMSDVDKSIEYRVRTLYGYEGEGADDLCEFFCVQFSFGPLK